MNYTKNMRGFILLLVIIVSAASSYGQTPTPGKKQEKSIIYINATVHIGDGTKVLKGAVGFDNGLISYVGATPEVRKNLYYRIQEIIYEEQPCVFLFVPDIFPDSFPDFCLQSDVA